MIDQKRLEKMIVRLKRIRAPYIVVDAVESHFAQELEESVIKICNKMGLMIYIDRDQQQLKIRNLFYSNN